MQEPKIIKDKRTNYLTHFREGASDAMFNRDQYESKKSSDYYKKGYAFGSELLDKVFNLGNELAVNSILKRKEENEK
jgi:hypothetical protein|tara:strand:- start:2453 stop:2683 length:231 start_codon:yes stop_codon:yes gene_type:complete